MEIACAFFECRNPAQQFLRFCTHKHPLCDQHFSLTVVSNRSRVSVLPISQWSNVQSKTHLPSSTLDVFAALQKAADTMLQVTEDQLNRVCEAIDQRMKNQIVRANRLARVMISSVPIDRSALITAKCNELRFLAKERRFHRSLVEYLRKEVRSIVQDLKSELEHHEASPSAELSPLARAFAASVDFLQYFVPCLSEDCCDLETQPWPEVDIKVLKRVEAKQLLTSALNFSFCAAPVFAELQYMRKNLHNRGNDRIIEDIEVFPEVCKELSAQLRTVRSPTFYSIEQRETLQADEWLNCQTFRLRAKVLTLPARSIRNDPINLTELSDFVQTRNQRGVGLYQSENFSEALRLFHAARSVRKRIPECSVTLAQILYNTSGTLEKLHRYSEAATYYQKFAAAANGQPDTDPQKVARELSALYLASHQYSEAVQYGKQALELATAAVPHNATNQFLMLRQLANAHEWEAEHVRAAELRREALGMCFKCGAANEPYGEACLELSRSELALQHFEESAALLEQAQAALGAHVSVLFMQARLSMALYRLPQTRTVLIALARRTRSAWSHIMLARVARELENIGEGLQWASRSMKLLDPEETLLKRDIYIECGMLCCATKDWAKAGQWLRAATALPLMKQHHGSLRCAQATVALGENRLEHAQQLLEAALAADEQVQKVHMDVGLDLQKLGELRLRQNRLEESEKCLRRAIEIQSSLIPNHPRLAESYFWLANVLFVKEDFDGALSVVSKSLEIDQVQRPGHSSVARSLQLVGRILSAKGDTDSAVQCLQQALSIYQAKAHMESEASETLQLLSQLGHFAV